jgi:translocation and assembly module TamB
MRKRALKWLGRAGAALVVLVALMAGVLATSPGQNLALGLGAYLASDADSRIEIGVLEGSLFDTGRIARIVVHDRDGPWLQVREVRFAWRPWQLLTGTIAIDKLVVASVEMARQPVAADDAPKGGASGGPVLFPLAARHVELSEIVLGPDVLGRLVRLRVTASADLVDASRGLSADLAIARADEPRAQLQAVFRYRPKNDAVELRVEGSEPADGLIAHVLDFPQRPPLSVSITGSGPRDRWRADWSLAASGEAFAGGSAAIDRVEGGHKLAAEFEGYFAHVVPAVLTGVLDGRTSSKVTAFWSGRDRVDVHELSIASAAMHLSASGALDLERRALHGSAAIRLAREDAEPVEFTVAPGKTFSTESLSVHVSLPDTLRRVARADIDAKGLRSPFGSAASFRLAATATQAHAAGKTALDADKIAVAALLDGVAPHTGAGQESAKLEMSGALKTGVLTIANLRAEAAGSTLVAAGTVEDGRFEGSGELQAPDLSRFAEIAGRPLAGALAARVGGTASLSGDEIALDFAANGQDISAGLGSADGLLAGPARITGRVSRRGADAIDVEDFVFKTNAAVAQAEARIGEKSIALGATFDVHDLSKAGDGLAGSAALKIDVSGPHDDIVSKFALSGVDVRVHGAKLDAPELSFAGRGPVSAHKGAFKLTGALDGQPIDGTGAVGFGDDTGLVLDRVTVTVASAQIDADVRLPTAGSPTGRIDVKLPRLADFARLAGVPLKGSAKADIAFSEADGVPVVVAHAEAAALRVDDMQLRGLSTKATVADYARALRIDGKVRLAALDTAQLNVRDLQIDAAPSGGATSFKAAGVINEFRAALSGKAVQNDTRYLLTLASLNLSKDGLSAVVDEKATLVIDNGAVKIDRLVIKTGQGRTQVAGTAGPEAFNIDVAVKRLPAALANAFDRTLGLEGHIDGTIKVAGTTAKPQADATLSWSGASAEALRAQSLPALRVDVRAKLGGEQVTGEVTVGGVDGFVIKGSGRTGLAATSQVKARIDGSIPLVLANGVLGTRAASADGTLRIEADISGTASAPQIAGALRIEGAAFNDPASGLRLVGIAGSAQFTQAGITITDLKGSSARGGAFASNGSVTLGEGGAMLADVRLDVAGLKFDDRELMSGELDANLAVKGRTDDLLIRGTLGLKRLDVIVPSQLPQSITSLDIKHVNAPAGSRAARTQAEADTQSSPPIRGRLDVRLDAADRIFVRGRGLDAQLGGGLHIRGTTDAPVADGAFVMQRGRLTIVGRQLDFRHGRITFNGSLDPQLDMAASADADGYTVTVAIMGPAAKPRFKFSSDPALPEDEAMARLLFNTSLAKLSPVQLAQLASEVDKIGGLSSGPGTLDKLKSAVGVDVLDVSTGEGEDPTVSAGSYVDENTYVGVRQGTSASSSRVVVDHDFTNSLKARGELGADGNSKIGIGVEWDY